MATPGRPSPPSLTAAVRSKSPFTYSFAQQMPPLPSRPRTNTDSNFPTLFRPSPVSSAPAPAWPHTSTPQKATAAEVVAGAVKTSDLSQDQSDLAVDHRREAEFALYSKLIPTTSAVPRNPGRSLGGGGLRATGSVAAPKSRPVTPTTPLPAAQPLPREPMASRMKSLSSEATKPQLARRVARPSKSSSTTPPLTTASDDAAPPELVKLLVADSARGASPNFTTPAMTNIAAAEPVAGITPRLREAPIDTKDAYMRSIRSIYGNVDCDLPSRRSDSATGPVGRKNTDASAPTSQPQQTSRRLDEAFKAPTPAAPSRYEGKRNPPPVTSRKDQIGALRRSSAPSPPPRVSGGSRKTNGRESSSTPVKNGRKASMAESPVDVPPGFESRTSAVSRGAFLGRGKTDSDVGSGSKSTERERDPVLPRPSNSRADAFREAINTRRQSVSPRSTSSRRTKTPDSKGESPHDSSNGRLSMAKEDWRLRNGDKEPSRQVTSASKLPSGVLGALQQEKERSRRKSDIATLLRPEEKIMRRRLERTTEAPVATAVSVDSGSTTKTRNALPLKTNRTDSMTNPSVAHGGQVEEFNPKMSEDRVTTLKAPKDRGVFAGNGNINPRRPSKLVPEDSRKSNDHPIGHPMLESRQVNGWANGSPEVIDGVAEACVNSLLENEDDYVPPSSLPGVSGTAPALPSNGPSMIDMMRACHANEPSSSVLSTSDRQEDVLPPLPNPEEDVRFETMLRSMGWSPPEEDETIRYHRNGISLHSDQDPSRSNSSLPEMVGIRQAENGDVRSGYYSHFH